MNVLITDDSAVNRKLFAKLIKKLGYGDAATFASSSAALGWAIEHEVDLVIVDYKMPAPDGLRFIELIRSMRDKETVPILMVTADHDKQIRQTALELGANDFLTKPIDVAEFSARVRNMLTLRESQRQLAETATWLAEQVKAATAEIVARERETIMTLSIAAERRNPETASHLARMAHYCESIARASGLPKSEQDLILATSPLHDIGKIAVPDHILLKPGKLTSEEFAIMKRHTLVGYEILMQGRSNTLQMAAKIALTHHERYDGAGYPHGLRGQEIPLVGRICAVADVFDALTSARLYKPIWPLEDAVTEINANASRHFDPFLVRAFNAVLPELQQIRARFPEQPSAGTTLDQPESLAPRNIAKG